MPELDPPRLSSAHLEDFAHVVLSADPSGARFDPYPDLTDDVRGRLRSRLKQLARYDWPSSLREDPALRRGYTLRQCCRLLVVLLLIDTHLPPSLAVALAQNNERSFLRTIAARLDSPGRHEAAPDDLMGIVLPGEIRDALPVSDVDEDCRQQVFLVERRHLANMWSDPLVAAGSRLVVDVPTAAAAMWRWLSSRRLMDDNARLTLISETRKSAHEPSFARVVKAATRKY